MLVGSVITSIISFFLNSYFSGQYMRYSSLMQLKDIMPSCVLAFVIALSIFFFKYLPFPSYIILFVQAIVGGIVFFVICEIMKIQEYVEIKNIAYSFYIKLKKTIYERNKTYANSTLHDI